MSGEPRTIAVVEDDDTIRALVTTLLEGAGYRVASTGDPRQAVELVRSRAPDLVLCDIAMPDLDGYGVLKALQSEPATAAYPVVFLTAHQEFTERVKAFRYGVVDYLTKPFTRSTLLRKIDRVLQSLDERSGVVEQEGTAAGLLEEVQRDARTGVLTMDGAEGPQRVVLRAGEIVESTADLDGRAPTGPGRFTELDAAREDIVAHDPPRLPSSSRGGLPLFEDIPAVLRKVLVVDDNAVFRRFLRDILASRGFTVHEAGDGEEALRLALEHRPWLILTDVRMPGEDGFTFCEKVRRHSLIRQTPLLFLSGWDDYKARYYGLELGADDFVSKDTPVRELLIRIQLILKRHVAVGSQGRKGAGMEGQIEVMGAPGVLQICHLTRLTGTLSVSEAGRRASVLFREGEIVGAEGDGLSGAEAVHALLAWERGSFEFAPGSTGQGQPLGERFDQLILDGCRKLDEARRQDVEPGT